MNADGSNQSVVKLDIPIVLGYRPAWSPDSQRLMFVHQQGGTLHVYQVNRDGTDLIQITSGAAFYSAPAWSGGP